MIGYMVQCDNSRCGKLNDLTAQYGKTPKGWITLSIGDEPKNDKHFCCIECLREYQELMNEVI